MSEGADSEHVPPGPDASIEQVSSAEVLPAPAVTLQGEAAASFLDAIGTVAKEGLGLAERSKDVYRVVPRKELAEGIKAGSLRIATAHKGGDTSVLVKSKETGRIAGHADLKRPGAVKLLGPAAWQAMAMATQQHYLVEITSKLASIQGGVDELLARLTDEKRAQLLELRDEAGRFRDELARGEPVPTEALRRHLHDAGALQKELALAAERAARDYLTGERSASEADNAFALALFAHQTLGELSAVGIAMPAGSADELQRRLDREHVRIEPARQALQSIAATLDRAHHRWRMHHEIYSDRKPKARPLETVNKVSPVKIGGPAPLGQPLPPEGVARTAAVLGLSVRAPQSLLVEVAQDGAVRVAVEDSHAAEPAPAELTQEVIERSVTRYRDGTWWVEGKYGPYKTREGAVARLRTLGPDAT